MCGIAGIFCKAPRDDAAALLHRMTSAMRHRGPDDEGYAVCTSSSDGRRVQVHHGSDTNERVKGATSPIQSSFEQPLEFALGHRRLSIIDLSPDGHQPMGSQDGRYWLTYNGEVYNYLELRKELESEGHEFRSGSDTEVLLAALTHWGKAAIPKLVGMFAFCFVDMQAQTGLIARDFFGIKPLYYTRHQHQLLFASEIKCLLETPNISRQVNAKAAFQYLRFGLTDSDADSFFDAIKILPPAHLLEFKFAEPANISLEQYWSLDTSKTVDLSFEAAAAELRSIFLRSVELHLRSDVPVGTALSGGIDSSAIVMGMRHLNPEQQIHTFSYIASDEKISEEKWSQIIVQAANTHAHPVDCQQSDVSHDMEFMLEMHDEPLVSTSPFAQQHVFRAAQQAGIKVMLDGQGADEILGGYVGYSGARLATLIGGLRWIRAFQFVRSLSKLPGRSRILTKSGQYLLPKSLQRPLRKWSGDSADSWLNAGWFEERGIDTGPHRNPKGPLYLRDELSSSLERHSLPQLLRYEDRNSMAYSIESRVPFLTPAIVEFLFALPEEYLISKEGVTKHVFREAMRGIVPDSILDRQDKIGFATPQTSWMKGLESFLRKAFQSEFFASGIFQEGLRGNLEESIERGENYPAWTWRWLSMNAWASHHGVTA